MTQSMDNSAIPVQEIVDAEQENAAIADHFVSCAQEALKVHRGDTYKATNLLNHALTSEQEFRLKNNIEYDVDHLLYVITVLSIRIACGEGLDELL